MIATRSTARSLQLPGRNPSPGKNCRAEGPWGGLSLRVYDLPFRTWISRTDSPCSEHRSAGNHKESGKFCIRAFASVSCMPSLVGTPEAFEFCLQAYCEESSLVNQCRHLHACAEVQDVASVLQQFVVVPPASDTSHPNFILTQHLQQRPSGHPTAYSHCKTVSRNAPPDHEVCNNMQTKHGTGHRSMAGCL